MQPDVKTKPGPDQINVSITAHKAASTSGSRNAAHHGMPRVVPKADRCANCPERLSGLWMLRSDVAVTLVTVTVQCGHNDTSTIPVARSSAASGSLTRWR